MEHVRGVCRISSLILLALLPFLIPFDAGRNVDMQGLIVLIAGALAWLSLPTVDIKKLLGVPASGLIVCFLLFSLLSLAINPHLIYNLIGAPDVRIGWFSFVAFLGCSLMLMRLRPQRLLQYIYLEIVLISAISLIYTQLEFNDLSRLGGIFAQADILAVIAGCGLLFGLELFRQVSGFRGWLILSQLLLALVIALTGTRAVMVLVILLALVWVYHYRGVLSWRYGLFCILMAMSIIGSFLIISPHRAMDVDDARSSIAYRLDLKKAGLEASWQLPVLGYGPGNLADALDCRRLTATALRETCAKHYFFNSSHNIFLDRVLVAGWLGGLAFLGFIFLSLYRGLGSQLTYIYGLVTLLVALYYLTNVTSVILELLLWVCALVCLRPSGIDKLALAGHHTIKSYKGKQT